MVRRKNKLCKHCGLRYPYLSEPARSHVGTIADLHRKGRSVDEIVADLGGLGIRPIHEPHWTAAMIGKIIRDHVS